MRLTTELITSSLSYNNPLNERELDLRAPFRVTGHKIPTIENLGSAKDQECIDFTDNAIQSLSGFPLSPRLHTLLLAHNRIHTISESTAKAVPNLHTLVLTQNAIAELSDVDALEGFTKLVYASFVGCPVASKENYRSYILWRCPSIRFLDFHKVKDAERAQGKELFGVTTSEPTELAKSIMAAVRSTNKASSAFTSGGASATNGTSNKKVKLTEDEKARYKKLVEKAKTLAEVQRLEKLYNEGKLPPGVMDGEQMDES